MLCHKDVTLRLNRFLVNVSIPRGLRGGSVQCVPHAFRSPLLRPRSTDQVLTILQ